MVPIITWIPWNPVIIKNKEPKIPSVIEKDVWTYSKIWINVKIKPRKIVYFRLFCASILSPRIMQAWHHVTVTPDNNNKQVFNKGTFQGLNGIIPNGGQTAPIQILGERLEWKKAQKKEIKNIISDTKNKTKPNRKLFCTANVWWPR